LNITIKTILHKEQRYNTLGDWWFNEQGDLEIRVSNMNNWQWEFIIALHELCEVVLCKIRGISTKKVDDFDMEFERNRKPDNEDEPGDNPNAPYYKEHFFATNIEKMMAHEMGLDWRGWDPFEDVVE
jgi:hypothetical protein